MKRTNNKLDTILLIMLFVALGLFIGAKLYVTTKILPMGKKVNLLRQTQVEIMDNSRSKKNELSLYTSVELIRYEAENQLNMQSAKTFKILGNTDVAIKEQ